MRNMREAKAKQKTGKPLLQCAILDSTLVCPGCSAWFHELQTGGVAGGGGGGVEGPVGSSVGFTVIWDKFSLLRTNCGTQTGYT